MKRAHRFGYRDQPKFGDGWVAFPVMEAREDALPVIVDWVRYPVMNAFGLFARTANYEPPTPNSERAIDETRRSYYWHRACRGGRHMIDCACKIRDLIDKDWP